MKFVPNAVSIKVAKQALIAQQHSPKTLFIGGMIGMGATIVLACKATLEVERILDIHESKSELINKGVADPTYTGYDAAAAKRDRVKLVVQTGVEFGKAYGPAIIVGAVSVSALAGSHNILSRRNAALTAAYGTVSKAYEEYRDRVRDAIGEKKELEIYHDMAPCEIEDSETGRKVKVKKATKGGSPYARLFEESNVNHVGIPEMNITFLKLQQRWANQQLNAKGYLFLNDVYDALGLEKTKAGQVVGWVSNGKDGFVDFGIFLEGNEEYVVDYMLGREDEIWLDFNVDGVVYDVLKEI